MCYRTLDIEYGLKAGETCAPEAADDDAARRAPRYQRDAGSGGYGVRGSGSSGLAGLTETFCGLLAALRPFPEALAAARGWLERLTTGEVAVRERGDGPGS